MSYEIYFDKKVLKIKGETEELDRYIYLIQSGSSNCQTLNNNGRYVQSKSWKSLDYEKKQILTKEELLKAMKKFKSFNETFKSKENLFSKENWVKWIDSGFKNAELIDDFLNRGNYLCLSETSEFWTKDRFNYYKTISIDISNFKNRKFLLMNSDLLNNCFISIDFLIKKKREKTNYIKQKKPLKKFFAIKISELGSYYVRKTKFGFKHSIYLDCCKKLKSKKLAENYIKEYLFCSGYSFLIEEIINN